MSGFKMSLTRNLGKVKLWGIKKSPEILLVTGLVAGGLCVYEACKGTLKAGEIVDSHKEMIDKIHKAKEIADEGEYTEKDVKMDLTKAYVKTGVKTLKAYAPAIIFGAVSVGCILTSHGLMKKRNLALAASLATVRQGFEEYRSRVIRDLGKEMDEHFLYDTEDEVHEETTVDSKGKEKKKEKTVKKAKYANAYSRIFDESNKHWVKDGGTNYLFIRAQLVTLQKKLEANNFLFLNDVYKELGFPLTIAGQTAGWIYDYNDRKNTMIFFEGFDLNNEANSSDRVIDLMNGSERSVLLNFLNVRDTILDDIPRVNSEVANI